MFLSFLVENFFMIIFRPRIFFVPQKLNYFSCQVFEILQGVKIKRFSVTLFFALESATNIWPQITRQSSRSISCLSYRLASTLKRTGRVDFLMSVLETMGQLYTVRLLECKNWSTLKVNLKSSFGSLTTSRWTINPWYAH